MAKIAFSFRIDESLYETLKRISDIELRSLNAQCEYFLKQAVEEYIEERENIRDCTAEYLDKG